jgi:curli biogenesis system outer membrane secretion channel CsgG
LDYQFIQTQLKQSIMKTLSTLILAILFSITINAQLEEVPKLCKGVSFNQRPILAVYDFEISARGVRDASSSGMRDMLANALGNCGCFRVAERKNLNSVQMEQSLGLGGGFNTNTTAQTGKLAGAQIIVSANLTEFKEKESGAGIGGFARKLGVGGVGMTKAHIGMIIKLIDAETGITIASKSVEKKVKKVGAIGGTGVMGAVVGAAFYKSKAMADAIEETMIEALQYIVAEKANFPQAIDPNAYANNNITQASDCPTLNSGNVPRVMIVIPEQHISTRVPDPAGETEMIRKFLEIGYNVVDPDQVVAIYQQGSLSAEIENPAKAAELGKRFGADVIIIGEAFSQKATRGNGNMLSCRARVEARAIETATGRILAANGTHAGGVDIAEFVAAKAALRNAGGQLGDYFINQLCEKNIKINKNKLSQNFSGGSTHNSLKMNGGSQMSQVKITVENANFMMYRKLQKSFTKSSQMECTNKTLSNSQITLVISTSKSVDDIADALIKVAGSQLEITDMTSNKISGRIN